QGDLDGGLSELTKAHDLDERNPLIRAVLVENLLKRASAELEANPILSQELVAKAIRLDPTNRQAVNLQRLIADRGKDKAIDLILSRSREVQASRNITSALSVVEEGLATYPDEPRLLARREALLKWAGSGKRPANPDDARNIAATKDELAARNDSERPA